MNRLMWPGCIFILVGALITVDVTMVIVANNRPSFAVHPTYNTDDASWTAQQQQQQVNARLGWTVTVERADQSGHIEIAAAARDHKPIEAANLTVRMYHKARASTVLTITLIETQPGRYVGQLPLDRAGHWRCEIDLQHGDDRFLETKDVVISETQQAGART